VFQVLRRDVLTISVVSSRDFLPAEQFAFTLMLVDWSL
jgi:hypothetical protein